ncbi:hypothetical protein QQM79_18690 [Marinobacteraceae bacterium S3BR75-40.1]
MDVITSKACPEEADYHWLQQQLVASRYRPEILYYCSSSEVYCWHDPLTRHLGNELRKAYPDIPHRLVAQGCLSFFGLILDFCNHEAASEALVVVSEPENLTQHLMDCIGIGRTNGPDSLIHSPALGAVRLRKESVPTMDGQGVYIASCELLSKRQGVSATVGLVERLVDSLVRMNATSPKPVVSFQTQSSFSTHLLDLANHKLAHAQASIHWLDSIDAGDWHYMSMKPLLELQRYHHTLQEGELAIAVLGVGGRFGILDVRPANRALPWRDVTVHQETASFRTGYNESFEVLNAAASQQVHLARRHLKCTTPGADCPDNHYYRWDFDEAPLAAPVQHGQLEPEVRP